MTNQKYYLPILLIAVFVWQSNAGNQQLEGSSRPMEKEFDIRDLRNTLNDYLSEVSEFVAVSVQLTDRDLYLGIRDTISVHAASTMKVPVMMEVFRQAESGRFALDDSLIITNKFSSIMDGSPYTLDVSEDGGDRLYSLIGKKETIRSLVHEMIAYSGNLATNLLIDFVGPQTVQALMISLGANDIKVLRGVEDIKAFRAGKNNTTTSKDLAILYQAILQSEIWAEQNRTEMLNILSGQTFKEKIPAGLPETVKVAHKTGSITAIDHDSGIIFPENRPPYILVVLTKGFAEHQKAQKCIADISAMVYSWYQAE